MSDPFDPERMTPEQRVEEVAAILARGYLRYRALRATGAAPGFLPAPPPDAQEPQRQPENDLEIPGDQSVHVPTADAVTRWPERS